MRARLKTLLGLVVLGGIVALVASGVYEDLSAQSIRARLLDAGPWGGVGFVIAFALFQPIGVAAHIFVVAASLVWPPEIAFSLSWTGAMTAACASFYFARFMAHDWVQARLPARLRGYDDHLERHGFRTVLLLRLMLFTLGPMQLMLGVSRVRILPFLAGTALGIVPLIAAETWLGAGVLDWLMADGS